MVNLREIVVQMHKRQCEKGAHHGPLAKETAIVISCITCGEFLTSCTGIVPGAPAKAAKLKV